MKMDLDKLYGYTSWLKYILWLLLLNLALAAVNLPFLFCAAFLELNLPNLLIFLFTGVTIGPSVYAALATFPNIERGVFRHFFNALRDCWKRVLKLWIPAWIVLVLLFADVMILDVLDALPGLKWVCVGLLCLFGTYLLAFFMVWVEWKQTIRDAAILTAKLALVKPIQYNLNFLILLGTVVLLALKPIYLILYGAALALFLVRLNFTPVIKFVNERPENRECQPSPEDQELC